MSPSAFRRAAQAGAPVDVLNVRTGAPAEWAWVAGRFAVAALALAAIAIFLRDTPVFLFLVALVATTVGLNTGLAVLLARGRVRAAFLGGLVMDTASILVGWAVATRLLAGNGQANDAYLIFFPILVAGVARLGWPLGVAQAALFIGWIAGANVLLLDSTDFLLQQLPLRALFLAMTAGLTVWLVSQIRTQRHRGETLWRESETLAGIGRVITASPNIDEVLQRFAAEVRKLIPFDRISVSTIEGRRGTVNLRYAEGTEIPDAGKAARSLQEASLAGYVVHSRSPIRIGTGESDGVPAGIAVHSGQSGFGSSLSVPIMSDGVAIGALSLHAHAARRYTERDQFNLQQVADQISGALATELNHARELELIEAQSRLKAENRELERVNEEKSRFLSAVSHELKTPLTSMLAFTDILRRSNAGARSERDLKHLEIIKRNGQRLAVLIDDLIDVSRYDAGALSIDPTEFDVCQLIGEIAESFRPMYEAKQQALNVSLTEDAVLIRADRQRFAQVITNLLSNASKYSPERSSVDLEVYTHGGRLGVAVRDHGIGISFEDQEKLFTPFFRVDEEAVRMLPGTGLGLAVSRSIVEAHHGEITVSSEPGRGSVFFVSMPGAVTPSDEVAEADSAASVRAA